MHKLILPLAAVLALPQAAAGHEIWLERDDNGVVRAYLGEPDLPLPAGGEPQADRLQNPLVFLKDPTAPITLTDEGDYLEATVAERGDVRLRDAAIFEPWQDGDVMAGVVYYARAGRRETEAKLDLEFVPVSPGADEFTVMFRGRPVAGANVRLLGPGRWQKTVTTDADGRVRVGAIGPGRYILAVTHEVEESARLFDTQVSKVQHISTLTFQH